MKYIIGSIIVVAIGMLVWSSRQKDEQKVPPISDTVLAGPQEPVPIEPKEKSLPTNKTIIKNNMKIEITKEGSGPEIKNGQTAVVTYVGKLENGTVFDASKNHGDGSFSFVLGAGMVIKGWDQGVLGMKIGETRTLTIPADLAYGSGGVPGAIPPNATLIFDVELLAIK